MNWRESLRTENNTWLGIAQKIADITKEAMQSKQQSAEDITNFLRREGAEHIRLAYVEEYLSGSASFGCFFPQLRDYLEISPEQIFQNVLSNDAKQYIKSLDSYLTDSRNLEALVVHLKYKPGKELRDFVSQHLTQKREERLRKPFHSIEVEADQEEDKDIFEAIKSYISESQDQKFLPEDINLNNESALAKKGLYDKLMSFKPEPDPDHRSFLETGDKAFYKLFNDCEILVQPSLKRGVMGFTVDFLSAGELFDEYVATQSNVSVEAWKEAYIQGTFTQVEPTPKYHWQKDSKRPNKEKEFIYAKISDMAKCVGSGCLALVPIKEPTEAEKYEAHQRYKRCGNYAVPLGTRDESKPLITPKDIPNPRKPLEEAAYKIETHFGALVIPLSQEIHNLVLDRPLLTE